MGTAQRRRETALDILIIGAASALYAFGFSWFFEGSGIAYGGVTGIAMALNRAVPAVPVGSFNLLINVPLFVAAWRLVGRKFLLGSLFSTVVISLLINWMSAAWIFQPVEPLLAALYGGLCIGISLGLIFLRGASTGGIDVGARLLKRKLPHLPMGRLMLLLDLAAIAVSALSFGRVESALYGLVALYLSTLIIDLVLYGANEAKLAYIVSDRAEDIARDIVERLSRGVTLLNARGGFDGAERTVLLCAFKKQQIVELKRTVMERDPGAFLIVCKANEVLGEGFSEYDQHGI